MITSYWGDEESGARRRYYSITPAGKAHYEKSKQEWENAKELIQKLVEVGDKK